MPQQNRQWLLASRPTGMVTEQQFDLAECSIPEPADGEIVVQSQYWTVDPYMRGRMSDRKSYSEPVKIGEVMTGQAVGKVTASRSDRFKEGDHVLASIGWQEFGTVPAKEARRLDPTVAPISTALHVLGMPGITAYFGLLDIIQAKTGQTIVVSGAAGAVGSTVGQIAKIKGCRTVGIAGSDEKTQWLTKDLEFDAAINYKTSGNLFKALKEHCPDGIHGYFDNVGGPTTDAIFPLLALNARIGICGQISQYNLDQAETGPRLLWNLIVKRATIQGFLVFDFADRYREALTDLSKWVQDGSLQYKENLIEGFEKMPEAFIGLFDGTNTGKQLIHATQA
jgi:NADPH:quinone reductase